LFRIINLRDYYKLGIFQCFDDFRVEIIQQNHVIGSAVKGGMLAAVINYAWVFSVGFTGFDGKNQDAFLRGNNFVLAFMFHNINRAFQK
jgi:hypothetical protein